MLELIHPAERFRNIRIVDTSFHRRLSFCLLEVLKIRLSLAKTSSDSLRSPEIRQSVHGPKTPSLVGGRATGIVRPSALHGHTGVAMEGGKRAGWAAELDL